MRTQNRPPEDLEQQALRLIRQGKTNEAEKIYKELISGGMQLRTDSVGGPGVVAGISSERKEAVPSSPFR